MIHVNSYLLTRGNELIPVSEVLELPRNPRHVEGAIDLMVNGVSVIDKTLWDDVDQLWTYMSDMVLALNDSNESKTFSLISPSSLRSGD